MTREGVLRTPGFGVTRGDYVQTDSPTLSSHRAHWSELNEWVSFSTDFQTFWNSIDPTEKNEVTHNVEFLHLYYVTHVRNLPQPTNEDMLSSHLDKQYVDVHNSVITPSHSKIIRRDGSYPTFGYPDYLFVAHIGGRALHAIMELKTFWKVTVNDMTQVLDGNFLSLSPDGF